MDVTEEKVERGKGRWIESIRKRWMDDNNEKLHWKKEVKGRGEGHLETRIKGRERESIRERKNKK